MWSPISNKYVIAGPEFDPWDPHRKRRKTDSYKLLSNLNMCTMAVLRLPHTLNKVLKRCLQLLLWDYEWNKQCQSQWVHLDHQQVSWFRIAALFMHHPCQVMCDSKFTGPHAKHFRTQNFIKTSVAFQLGTGRQSWAKGSITEVRAM